ncbi:UNVERIFIED_CONTAM: hypothetical protein PYX00_003279 [Menopon gallinae]|uniref:Uncharacterized protein n=1 Tax=Menopon gallinae TaxID=328185 RepID=A0AAW2I0K0_9NEOP
MTAVLSTVALVYLTVAIYVPSMKAFQSGINEVPVMCTTQRAANIDSCSWATCVEWCLTKSSGACIQIYVTPRRNGSNLLFQNCTNMTNRTCYGIDQENAKKYRCIADDCKNLTGTFNCTEGVCVNITDAFTCEFKMTDPPMKCSDRRGKITCSSIAGLQSCKKGTCERIRTPYNCDRKCVNIPTRNKNVILLSGDVAFLSQCQKAIHLDTGKEIWTEERGNILVASCYLINNTTDGIEGVDCINGTLLEKNALDDWTNFTYLLYLSVFNTVPLDENRIVAPPEHDLIIANESKLLINLDGCVNTLKDECRDFLRDYGKDGTDHNAKARFPCFYSDNDPELVVARFDLATTYREFLIASLLPSVLFVVSCLTLLLCQRTVVVGDDAKMRFKCSASAQIIAPQANGSGGLGDTGSAMAL